LSASERRLRKIWRSLGWYERLRLRLQWPSTATRGDRSMNYYPLLIALGLLFLAASFLVTQRTGRIVLVVLSCVAFLVAAILTVVGTAGVPGS
jgi:hypothetical protein